MSTLNMILDFLPQPTQQINFIEYPKEIHNK
jgi:hypothetical protein